MPWIGLAQEESHKHRSEPEAPTELDSRLAPTELDSPSLAPTELDSPDSQAEEEFLYTNGSYSGFVPDDAGVSLGREEDVLYTNGSYSGFVPDDGAVNEPGSIDVRSPILPLAPASSRVEVRDVRDIHDVIVVRSRSHSRSRNRTHAAAEAAPEPRAEILTKIATTYYASLRAQFVRIPDFMLQRLQLEPRIATHIIDAVLLGADRMSVAAVGVREVCDHPFYIGITEDPVRRWHEHSVGWDAMSILFVGETSQDSGHCEKTLLKRFGHLLFCQNTGPGGEHASSGRPHFTYVVHNYSGGGLIRRPLTSPLGCW